MHDLDWPTPTLDAGPFDHGSQVAHIAGESMPYPDVELAGR